MSPLLSRGWGQAGALFIGIALAGLLMRNVFAQSATPGPVESRSAVVDDGGCEPDNACRSQHGNIFFGQVVAVVELGEFPGELPLAFVVYAVDVERSLRHTQADGAAGHMSAGRVLIEVVGLDLPIAENGRAAPLAVGERYLFFAGMDVGRGYLVDYEVGFLPVANDNAAETLTEEFVPLIRQDQQEDRSARLRATEAARYEPRTPPIAQIEPRRGPAGTEVVVTGSGFTPAIVVLLWDVDIPEPLPEVIAGPDGRLEITLTVPKSLDPGPHTLSVAGHGSDAAAVTFEVEK